MGYRYDRRKTAGMTWKKAGDKFIEDFRALVSKELEGLAPKVERLVEQLQKDLGEGWEFQRGKTPKAVAKSFVNNVFEGEAPYNEWAVDNFFRQGYFHLEYAGVEKLAEELIKDVVEKYAKEWARGVQGRVEIENYAGTIDLKIHYKADIGDEAQWDAVDDFERKLTAKVKEWLRKKDAPKGSVYLESEEDGIRVQIQIG
jgi:uncharacterized alkaline shock family protein YloU